MPKKKIKVDSNCKKLKKSSTLVFPSSNSSLPTLASLLIAERERESEGEKLNMNRRKRSLPGKRKEIEITETRPRIGIRRDENVGRIQKNNFPSVVITFSSNIFFFFVLNFVTGVSGIKYVSSMPAK